MNWNYWVVYEPVITLEKQYLLLNEALHNKIIYVSTQPRKTSSICKDWLKTEMVTRKPKDGKGSVMPSVQKTALSF